MLPLLFHVFVIEMDVDHGAVDVGMTQALLDITDIPVGADQLRYMTVSQHVRVERKLGLAAVMLEHCFNCMAVQWAAISSPSMLISCRPLEDDEKVVCIKVMLQDQVIQKSHHSRR